MAKRRWSIIEGPGREALDLIERARSQLKPKVSQGDAADIAGIDRKYWSALVRRRRSATGTDTLLRMAFAVHELDQVATILGISADAARSLAGQRDVQVQEYRQRLLAEQRRKILAAIGIPDADKLAALRVIEEAEAHQPPGDELYDDGWTPKTPPGHEPGGE